MRIDEIRILIAAPVRNENPTEGDSSISGQIGAP